MRLWSYVPKRFEDGGFSGVCRFDWEIRKVFPRIRSVTKPPKDLDPEQDLVITANHLSLDVPEEIKTVVVHHGCAQTHFDRDPGWRTDETLEICRRQKEMFKRPNRIFVSPSRWCAEEFLRHGFAEVLAEIIPHWVETISRRIVPRGSGSPVVLGDWRDRNKGVAILETLRKTHPELEFRQLRCDYETRAKAYRDADVYLGLSVSEGGSYALSDAEAAGLPIVMTDVGNYLEYSDRIAIPWENREDPDLIAYHLGMRARTGRMSPSFFDSYTFDKWKAKWEDLVRRFWDGEIPKAPEPEPESITVSSRVLVGCGSGIGNVLFNLPALKALHEMGNTVLVYCNGDYGMRHLLNRCRYVDAVYIQPDAVPEADAVISGPFCPKPLQADPRLRWFRWHDAPPYCEPEWKKCWRGAEALGAKAIPQDVTDWCRYLPSETCGDHRLGVAPGCKPDPTWARKRYPRMVEAVQLCYENFPEGVAWFGLPEDRPEGELPGKEHFGEFALEELPDRLFGCRGFLGTDSGITHLAASLGVPTAILYTATSEIKGDPVPGSKARKLYRQSLECRPCTGTSAWFSCESWRCQEIPPEKVAEALRDIVRENA